MKNNSETARLGTNTARHGLLPKVNAIGSWSRAASLLGAVACLAAMPAMAGSNAVGTGSCGTATIDGNDVEWNQVDREASWDFRAHMFKLNPNGTTTTEVIADLFMRWKNGVAYVLVLATDGNRLTVPSGATVPVAADAWVKNYNGVNPLIPWTAGPVWVGDSNNTIIGYEASFAMGTGFSLAEFNAMVTSNGTSYRASTGTRVSRNTLTLSPPDCHVGIGDRIFIEADGSPGYAPEFGDMPAPSGIPVEIVNADTNALVATATTDEDGCYLVEGLTEGRYFARLPKQLFDQGGRLYRFTPAADYTAADGAVVQDDDKDQNGFASAGAVVTGSYQLVAGGMPITNRLSGGVEVSDEVSGQSRACQLKGNLPDPSVNRTADIGLVPEMVAIGNLAWKEDPNNPHQTPGEFQPQYDVPLKNVTIYLDRIDPYVPESTGSDRCDLGVVASYPITSDAQTGFFLSDPVVPGYFRLRIDSTEFTNGRLNGLSYASPGFAASGALTDDDHVDHNALPWAAQSDYASHGACTATFQVWPGYAPTEEGGAYTGVKGRGPSELPDENVDLTRDLAFTTPLSDNPHIMSIGSALWIDANHNGKQDTGEPGIGGVKLILTGGGLVSAKETVTSSDPDKKGTYLFRDLAAGSYTVTIPADQMANGGPISVALRNYYSQYGVAPTNVPPRAVSTAWVLGSATKMDGVNKAGSTGNINVTVAANPATANVSLVSYGEPRDDDATYPETAIGHAQDQDLVTDPLFAGYTADALDENGTMALDLGFVHACQEICDVTGATTGSAPDGKVTATDIALITTWGGQAKKADKTNLAHTGNCQQTGTLSRNDALYCNKLVPLNAR